MHVSSITKSGNTDVYIFWRFYWYNIEMETLTPEQQLQQIEHEHQIRREAAAESESEYESMSRVVEDKIQEHAPDFQASSHMPRTMTEAMPADEQSKLQELVTESFPPGKGVWAAIKDAANSNDTALLDAFHAALSGQLYDQLVASKQLKKVA